jgi:hypothetical protein
LDFLVPAVPDCEYQVEKIIAETCVAKTIRVAH